MVVTTDLFCRPSTAPVVVVVVIVISSMMNVDVECGCVTVGAAGWSVSSYQDP